MESFSIQGNCGCVVEPRYDEQGEMVGANVITRGELGSRRFSHCGKDDECAWCEVSAFLANF